VALIYGSKENYSFSEGLAAVKLKDKWGYIDKMGKTVIPFQYDGTLPFSDGLSAARQWDVNEGKWSYIDRTGKVVIPPSFEEVSMFSEGVAWVRIELKNGTYQSKYGYIRKRAT
jgi:WG containing repeat